MTTMRATVGLLLILAGSCVRRPYQPAGGAGALNVSGYYELTESIYSNNCGPGVQVRKEPQRVKVEHTAGGGFARIILNDHIVYDASVRSDGNFAVAAARGGDARGTYARNISGRFTDSAMFARVTVDSIRPEAPTGRPPGAGDQALRNCQYSLRWDAKKI